MASAGVAPPYLKRLKNKNMKKRTKLKKGDVCVFFHRTFGMMIGYVNCHWGDSLTFKAHENVSIWIVDDTMDELIKIGKL